MTETKPSVLFIDNYDSFVFNLVDEFAKRGCRIEVLRNDVPAEEALDVARKMPAPRLAVISPGPGRPEDAGCSIDLIRAAPEDLAVFGVCLGHQAIITAFGGSVGRAGKIVHGKSSAIEHAASGIFKGIPSPISAGRYHSLVGTAIPDELSVTATMGSTVMAVEHRSRRIAGVQFHPESILTPQGGLIVEGVIRWAQQGAEVDMKVYMEKLAEGSHLTSDESHALFTGLIRGKLGDEEIRTILTSLRDKGERPCEIAGAALALRDSAEPFPKPGYECADTCGTGGDGAGTINISTAVAITAAEIGIPIAKHGNRSISSKCGSADVLEALGVRINATPKVSRSSLDEAGICFLFAPQYHAGMRHAMPARRAIGTRTIFNILGPLANPCRPAVQMLGVYSPELCEPIADTLRIMGLRAALVVHGSGLDEIAVHGTTKAALLIDGRVTEIEIQPEDAGLSRYPIESLRGGSAMENAKAIQRLLEGHGEPAHEAAVAINAGALAWIFGKAGNLRAGTEMALEALRSGRAAKRLTRFVEASSGS